MDSVMPDSSQESCSQPTNYVLDASDCNDSNNEVSPAEMRSATTAKMTTVMAKKMSKVPSDGSMFYADGDGDGYGDVNVSTEACSQPSGYVSDSTDCNDNDEDPFVGALRYATARITIVMECR